AEKLGVPTDVLPILFDAKMASDGGNKAMKAFLDGCASSQFDPVVYFANDGRMKPIIDQARRAGKVQTNHIVAYCDAMRAQQKDPAEPVMPDTALMGDVEFGELKKDNDLALAEWLIKCRE